MTDPNLTTGSLDNCCGEFRTSRRRVLAGMGAVAGAAVTSSMIGGAFREVAYGATTANPNVLVVLSLRGGADGLSLVVPHGDAAYRAARPGISIPTERLVARDDYFGLHPKLAPLAPLWSAGSFGAVHAVGLPQPDRSHFSAMEVVEDADPGSSERRGWINRLVGAMSTSDPAEAVQLGGSLIPTALYGPSPVLGMNSLADLTFVGGAASTPESIASTRALWQGRTGSLAQGVASAVETVQRFGHLASVEPAPRNGAVYPHSSLGTVLENTAHLIRSQIGARVITIDQGDWDMHVGLGNLDWGDMQRNADDLATSLAAFMTDLGTLTGKVTVVTISEFGRRVEQNGAGGLDHGYGNCMLLLGGGVRGGTVHGEWPGLGTAKLVDGDLRVTRDYRSVFAEIVASRFPEASIPAVFPDLAPEKIGAMNA
jgi:uncharacterized protein (DUF1501 family)